MTEKKEVVKEENKSFKRINYTAIAALSAIIGGLGVFAAGPKSYQVEMADVNNDGREDILVTDYNRQVKTYFADESGKKVYLSIDQIARQYKEEMKIDLEKKVQSLRTLEENYSR
ncbi:MAG: VCBS repeat-containing protein [Nanoarchaeota archaeon]|nr:VCBS repeat-containing protein [Nanoarchaeota archaeon]